MYVTVYAKDLNENPNNQNFHVWFVCQCTNLKEIWIREEFGELRSIYARGNEDISNYVKICEISRSEYLEERARQIGDNEDELKKLLNFTPIDY
jgi:hypothetical protein